MIPSKWQGTDLKNIPATGKRATTNADSVAYHNVDGHKRIRTELSQHFFTPFFHKMTKQLLQMGECIVGFVKTVSILISRLSGIFYRAVSGKLNQAIKNRGRK